MRSHCYPNKFRVEEEALAVTLKQAKKGIQPGRSGARFEHFSRMLAASERLIKPLTKLANLFARGQFPEKYAALYAGGRVTPVPKPDGRFRPVVVVEALHRLFCGAVSKQVRALADAKLAPLQTALHAGSTFTVPLAIDYALQSQNDAVGLCLDMSNAYSTVSRCSIVEGLEEAGLSMLIPLFRQSYGGDNSCSIGVEGQPKGFYVNVGIFAGDALSPLWFSVAMLSVLKKVQAEMGDGGVVRAYLDDIFCVGRIDALAKTLPLLIEQARRIGLVINPRKSVVIGYNPASLQAATDAIPGFREARTVDLTTGSHTVLGAPIGCEDAVKAWLDGKREAERTALEAIAKLGSVQCGVLVLRFVAGPRIMHLLRTVPVEAMKSYASGFDEVVMNVCQKLHGQFVLDEDAKRQVRLPLKRGGMGLTSAAEVSPCALLGAHADMLQSLQDLFPSLQQVISTQLDKPGQPVAKAMAAVRALRQETVDLGASAAQLQEVPDRASQLAAVGDKPQRRFSAILHERNERRYKREVTSPHKRANIESCENAGAAAVLSAQVMTKELTIDSFQFRIMLARRNMLSLESLFQKTDVKCPCGKILNASVAPDHLEDARHLETCKHLGGPIARHDAVRDTFAELLKSRNIAFKLEERIGDASQRRGDILIQNLRDEKGRRCMVDFTIASVAADAHPVPLAAARARAYEKHTKHDAQCAKADLFLSAAVMESTGALGSEARDLLNEVARLGGRGKTDCFVMGKHLAVALHRANAGVISNLTKYINEKNL